MVQQSGLGRGLASLIPPRKGNNSGADDADYFSDGDFAGNKKPKKVSGIVRREKEVEDSNSGAELNDRIMEVIVDSIIPNPYQPRTDFNEKKLQELADSIDEHGVLQPLVVTSRDDGRYELIAGERRLQASKMAGLEKVPVFIKDIDDQKKAELALVENLQRHNLNVIEEAKAYKKMQDIFLMKQDEIAFKVGRSRSKIANVLRLLKLPPEVQDALRSGEISEGHAKAILTATTAKEQRTLLRMIMEKKLSVREVEMRARMIVSGVQRRRSFGEVDPETQEKEDRMSRLFNSKVKIKKGNRGGELRVVCYSDRDFQSVLDKLMN